MISVLLPTYNHAAFLSDALDGIAAQTRKDFELIACDDGSTDETAEILKARNVRTVTHETNHGTAAAINSAFAASTGELVTWISSDNRMHPQWLEKLAGYLDGHPQARAVYSPYRRVDLFPDQIKSRPRLADPGPHVPGKLIGTLNCYFGPSFMVRRGAWTQHRDGMAHDYDWWLRFEEANAHPGAIGYVGEPLCDYRMGPWQTGRKAPQSLLRDARRRQAESVFRMMTNPGLKIRDLKECIRLATAGCDEVVEFGCGFGERLALTQAATRIGVDAHEPYIAEARRKHPASGIQFIVADAREYIRARESVGCVLMVDFLEHLAPDDAHAMVAECQRRAERIVLWVPLGHHPQDVDRYNMGGDHWQTHRSQWEKADLEAMGFNVKVWATHPNMPGIEPRAAFCVWSQDHTIPH